MGNEQSVPARVRGPNKLSKPRTNNNSSANLLNTKSAPPTRRNSVVSISASPTKSRYSFVPASVPEDSQKKVEKPKKRISLFRSKSAQTKVLEKDAESEFEHSSVEATIETRRWSKQLRGRESFVCDAGDEVVEQPLEMRPPPARKRMSLSRPYEHTNPRLSLVPEQPSARHKQMDTMQRPPGHEEEEMSHRLSRTQSEAELYMPIRRRSLLQHGVATRRSYVEETPPCLPPSPPKNVEEFQNYYYNPSKPTSSPLDELAALECPPEFLPGPRVETPTELDYGHIGAFKLGSLRITNGAASPVPSVEPSLRRAATMGQEEDYIMAGDARGASDRGHRQGLGQRSNTISVSTEQKAPWVVRAESPLRQHDSENNISQPPTRETQLEWNGNNISPMPPKCVFDPLTLDVPNPNFALFDFNATDTLFRSTDSPTKSLELANDYQQDILMSPFSFDNSPPVSPRLQVMSKSTAVEDDLFAPEPLSPALSERFPRSFDSAYEGGPPARTVKGPRDLTPKPLAKADSGYSSNVSLRSFKKESTATKMEAPAVPPKDTLRVASSTCTDDWTSRVSSSTYSAASAYSEATVVRAPTSRVPSSTYSTASASSDMTLRVQRSLPALPVEADLPGHPLRQCPPVPRKQGSSNEVLKIAKRLIPTAPSTHSPQVVRPGVSKQRSNPPNPSACQESPASEVSSLTSRWSKKSKRPQSLQTEPVYTVQAFRSPSEQLRIPAPTIEARRSLDKRVDDFHMAPIPDTYTQQLPNTYVSRLGMRRSSSKETLGTIFSVGSVEVREELSFARLQSSLPAVPTQPTIQEDPPTVPVHREMVSVKDTYRRSQDNVLPRLPYSSQNVSIPISSIVANSDSNRRNTYQAPLPALPVAEERSRMSMPSTARERSISRPRTQAEFESEITSFDGVSSSLGRSPYDAALSTSINERTKSATSQFDGEAADRYARQRSVSYESTSTAIRPRMSYESISTGNPFLEPESKADRSRGRPPQAHAKFNAMKRQSSPSLLTSYYSNIRREPSPANNHVGEQFGGWNEGAEEERRFSTLSTLSKKIRSPPPVSMTTQRKVTPNPPSSRTQQAPAHAPTRSAPQLQTQFAPPRQEPRGAEWSQPAEFWAERRNSAGEALKVQTRQSMEMCRPEAATELRSRKSMDAYTYRQQLAAQQQQATSHDLRARKSMDAQTYRHSMNGGENVQRQSLGSSYRSFDNNQSSGNGNGRKGWNVGVGYDYGADTSQAQSQLSWVDNTVRTNSSYPTQHQSQAQEYDHTYGTSSHHNKENFEHDYYDQAYPQDQTTHLPETIHQRKTSTSDMLVLDRFTGGLDYGYEAGQGLGGSAGTRNTGKMAAGRRNGGPASERYGLDFSEVPVILQRVNVRG